MNPLNLEPGHTVFERIDNNCVNATRRSMFSGKTHTLQLNVSKEQQARYQNSTNNELIQDIFPNLSPDEREFLLTGVIAEEWNEVFPRSDEED